MGTRMPSLDPRPRPAGHEPLPHGLAIGHAESDRLGRFLPGLLALTLAAAALEITAAMVVGERILAIASLLTALFALGVTLAGYQIRNHRPLQARVALAVTLTAFGAVGTALVPGVAPSMALVPVMAVVLVLRYVERSRLIVVVAAAVGSSVLILAIDAALGQRPPMPVPVGTVFLDAILVAVVLLLIMGLADFALEARDAFRDLGASTQRHLRVTSARLSIVGALRVLQALPTPEATAQAIADALGDLPLVDVAAIIEVSGTGAASVLAVAGNAHAPVHVGDVLPAARAAHIIERSRHGTWGEPWAERTMPTLKDERLTELGLKAQAFAPILSGDVIVGLVIVATTDPAEAEHLLADLPAVSEAAAIAGTILAPALMARRQTGAARIRIAEVIAARAFHPVFQPVVDLRSGLTVGFEALTRFAHGEPPDQVFSDAAEAGIGAELEAATLSAAVRDAAFLPGEAWLSLNVSPSFLAAYDELAGILAGRNRPIILEVTEHERIDDYARLHAATRTLGADIRLAVDDAGAGVANFRHLVDLRPDLVKIDAGIIRGIESDVSRQALVVGLVHFAEMSGAQLLAEGVETQSEQETVQRLGVTLAQGFLLARPAPIGRWIEAPVSSRARRRPAVPARAAGPIAAPLLH